jgi:alkylation response protein AidB-like acyl-CoA dehydrogenase
VRVAFSDEEEAFRREAVALLAPWRGLDGYFRQGERWDRVRALFRELGARDWLSLGWPAQERGAARSLSFEYLLWDEAAYARAARNPLASGIVAKTLARFGSDAQKARWLPPIRAGELHFALGYSEPEAGSDLASVRCRAERRGDVYVVTGRKCWQSYARQMDLLWLLCRTGSAGSRGRGLSLLVVDLRAPGVQVRPIPTLDGESLHEISLDGVEVPVDARVGPEDGAWSLMGAALADERHIQFPPGRVRRDLEEVVSFAREAGLAGDSPVRRTLAALAVRVREVEMHALRVLDAMQRGRPGVVEAAASKLAHTTVCQEIARAALDFGAPETLVHGHRVEQLWRQSLWETIGGGTSEILRGVVARHGLGLGPRG